MDAYQDAVLRALDGLGQLIFRDDEADFKDPRRRFGYAGLPGVKDHPSPLHHWQVGLVMRGGAQVTRLFLELMEVLDVLDGGDGTVVHPLEAEIQAELRGG